LVDLGARIWSRRCAILEELQPLFDQVFAQIHGPGATAAVRYSSRLETREGISVAGSERAAALGDALARRRGDDFQRGVTTVGPHRDDLHITLDDHPAGTYASQGQTRALMLSLKLAELRAARQHHGSAPVLLLDDVSSELDAERTAQLFSALAEDAGQCLLTTTEPRLAALADTPGTRRFGVVDGVLEALPAIG
jgi:DNA replication and repair protein RecF